MCIRDSFLIDEIELRPGALEDFLAAMDTGYRPGAEARGQRLVHTWVTPPTRTEGIPVSVMLVWQLDGVEGFWRMRSQNAADDVVAWWREAERYCVSRTRRYAASPAAVDRFEAFGRANA